LFHLYQFNSRIVNPTDAAVLFLGSQITFILRIFLSHNIRIARERAWAQTVTSRGKGPDFWQPYVEEWDHPPFVDESKSGGLSVFLGSGLGRFLVRRGEPRARWLTLMADNYSSKVLLLPFALYPFVGIIVSAWLRALGTARYLHKPVRS
jgi:hypothetical protein